MIVKCRAGRNGTRRWRGHLLACNIFVLLVSANSMGSDYIIDRELGIARRRQPRRASCMSTHCSLHRRRRLVSKGPRLQSTSPTPEGRFQSYSLADAIGTSRRRRWMAEIANTIAEQRGAAAAMSELLALPSAWGHPSPGPDRVGREDQRIAPGRERRTAPISISQPAETAYERFVGRDAELTRLDRTGAMASTNIFSLIAEGGAGKSALVNEWLTRLQADSYRARIRARLVVLQPGLERARDPADPFLNSALAKLGVRINTTSASAKGEAIAEALMARHVLLLLDGVEPLRPGRARNRASSRTRASRFVAPLRRGPAGAGHSLIVLTSRVAVADIQTFKDSAAPVVDVERLSDEAGAELLRDNDVWGIERSKGGGLA